ncbi:hypothetical protein B296_00014449 [Ensete ventricosum]|uniref:Uncharacterized protein n=1 Tax=Ensete ventricosum TaxID=4639 RepID=A0A427B1L8_ENSVE|nr:hypothetical protein B296_00014449 [Ensete ventricosum]
MKPPRTFWIRIRTRRTAANQGADAPRFTTPLTYTLHPEKPLPHRLNATYQPLSSLSLRERERATWGEPSLSESCGPTTLSATSISVQLTGTCR